MSYRSEFDRKNDARLFAALLLIAAIIVVGILLSHYIGH